jgi:signal transduction histidine kinase
VDVRVALEGNRLVLEVSDRGDGLSPGAEARAFEPFFTTRVHGTGLGLALARRVVEGHGGTIHADNREGGGAVFRITLPHETSPRNA